MRTRYTLGSDYNTSGLYSIQGYVIAVPIISPVGGSLSQIEFNNGANTGTVTSIGRALICGALADGTPNFSNPLTNIGTFTPIGGYNNQVLSFSTPATISANTVYYLCFYNSDSSPTSNFYQIGTAVGVCWGEYDFFFRSNDAGATWFTSLTTAGSIQLYIDGYWYGQPYIRQTNASNGVNIYRTSSVQRRQGIIFTVPVKSTPVGASLGACRTGTFTNARFIFEIYDDANSKLITSAPSNSLVSAVTTSTYDGTVVGLAFNPNSGVILYPGREYKMVATINAEEGDGSSIYTQLKQFSLPTNKPTSSSRNITNLKGAVTSSVLNPSSESDWNIYRDSTLTSLPIFALYLNMLESSSSTTNFSIFQSVIS